MKRKGVGRCGLLDGVEGGGREGEGCVMRRDGSSGNDKGA